MNYIYELFLLIIEKHRFKAKKICTKVYHIIYSLCRSTHQESNKIEFFILCFSYDLLWFFKDLAEINKKEKDKTTL